MRAKEFIVEYKAKVNGKAAAVAADNDAALPGVFVQRQLRNTDPYMQYRLGIATAAARADAAGEVDFNQESAWAENLVQVLYAAEDEETIKLASKMMGVTPTRITDNKSREAKGTSTHSPVAKIKKNRWGV
jgi:hypothetical protein